MLGALVCILQLIFVTCNVQEEYLDELLHRDKENKSSTKFVVGVVLLTLYNSLIACNSLMTGSLLHEYWKNNVTTNEMIRKKWNAKTKREEMSTDKVTEWEKLRYLYWEPIPRSRLEHWYKLRKVTVNMAKQVSANTRRYLKTGEGSRIKVD